MVTAFQCPHPGCGRCFSVQSNMRRHMRIHLQDIQRQQDDAARYGEQAEVLLTPVPTYASPPSPWILRLCIRTNSSVRMLRWLIASSWNTTSKIALRYSHLWIMILCDIDMMRLVLSSYQEKLDPQDLIRYIYTVLRVRWITRALSIYWRHNPHIQLNNGLNHQLIYKWIVYFPNFIKKLLSWYYHSIFR